MSEIKRLIRELKLNNDEANLVFAYFWSHTDLLSASGINGTQDFEINFDNVKRLPAYFLNFADNYNAPNHDYPEEFYKGIVKVHADSNTGKLSLIV